MKKNGKKLLAIGMIWMAAFAVFTFLVQTVDVRPIGPNKTLIGFAALNGWFHGLTGVHMSLYTITDWLGLVPIGVCMIFGVMGLMQLLKRGSLLKVDFNILFLGIYYGIVIFCYLLFETIPINYRPILIDGRLEASYPSSTTLLVISVMPTLIWQVKCRLKSANAKKAIQIPAALFSAFMVIGRLISGVHWFTDILAALMLGAGLFSIYKAAVLLCDSGQKN